MLVTCSRLVSTCDAECGAVQRAMPDFMKPCLMPQVPSALYKGRTDLAEDFKQQELLLTFSQPSCASDGVQRWTADSMQ